MKHEEVVEQDHEDYCYLWDINFKQRTLYSCNCLKRKLYRSEFKERRFKIKAE